MESPARTTDGRGPDGLDATRPRHDVSKGSVPRLSGFGPGFAHAAPLIPTSGSGTTEGLDSGTRRYFEARFHRDFGRVRLHSGEEAAAIATSHRASAYTVGDDIVVGGAFSGVNSRTGMRLLAHELTHVVQHRAAGITNAAVMPKLVEASVSSDPLESEAESVAESVTKLPGASFSLPSITGRARPNVLYRVPAPPSYGAAVGHLDRGAIRLDDVADFVLNVVGGNPSIAPQTVNPHIAPGAIAHITWMMFDPADHYLPGGFSTLPGRPDSTTKPFTILSENFSATSSEGRYLLRCIGLNSAHQPVAYSDRSFFVWRTKPIAMMGLAELATITADPSKHSLGEVGAATGRSMMLQHQQSVAATGSGKFMGSQVAGAAPPGVTKSDCTEYILDVLRKAFQAKGRAGDWKAVYDEAAAKSGPGGFTGMPLVQALETKAGWKGVFWGKDPRNPSDTLPEHPTAYRTVRATGKYYGAAVDPARSAVEYAPTSPTKPENMANLDRLRHIPLGLVATKGALHMGLLLNGQLYELHWDKAVTDPDVIQATPLEKWDWQTGVVVAPAEDMDAAWK